MHIFQRTIEGKIKARLFKGRAILIFGPRQSGKTTLSKKLISSYKEDGAYFNCELVAVRQSFVPGRPELLKELVGAKKIVVFDEAQTIQDIGLTLKTFIDTYPDVQIIATGSSSFDLANKINEPLTGRTFEFILLPLSVHEIQTSHGHLSKADIYELMRFGSYPAVVAEQDTLVKEDLVKNLATNYLYKDVYTFESIRNPRIFEDLVKLLALQTGSLVSTNELSQTLGVSRLTVEKYIRLLEQSYVVKVVRSYSRNPRTEMKKGYKVFFLDVGIRNAIVNNFSLLENRPDNGSIFENFFIVERMKLAEMLGGGSIMFWRSKRGEEIDVIEDRNGEVSAFECKWNDAAHPTVPAQFRKSYPEALFVVVSPSRLTSLL